MIIIDGTQYAQWSRKVFEEMRAGGVTAVHATVVYHANARETLSLIGEWQQLLVQNADLIRPIHTASDIDAAHAEERTGIILGFQNPSPIEDELNLVEVFYQLGVRFMQLTYNNQSYLGSGCYEAVDSGITRFGRQVIAEMNRIGMMIDMSHSGTRSTLEAIEISNRPICVSHANPKWWRDIPRNRTDDEMRALAESNGMLGFSLYPLHLAGGSDCTLEAFCEMVARTAEQYGTHFLGIGSDLVQDRPLSSLHWMRYGKWLRPDDDAPASWPDLPTWFANNTHFDNLIAGLSAVGFDQTEVEAIMGGNWHRFMRNGFGSNQA